MKDLMNVKHLCAAYNSSNSCKNNPEKTQFTLPKIECTRKVKIPDLNRKEELCYERYNVIVLLCKAKTQRDQSLTGTKTPTDLTSVIL